MIPISPSFFYRTGKTGVRPLTLEDVNGNYRNWLNDPEVCKFNSHGVFPYSIDELLEYVRSLSNNRSKVVWAISDENSRHIGNVSLQAINWVYRSAEFAIIIGEKSAWGKGHAYEASNFLLKHAFEKMNLHRIYCGTAEENAGMKKLAAKLKMKQEGIRREALFLNGFYMDLIEFGVLRNEFFAE